MQRLTPQTPQISPRFTTSTPRRPRGKLGKHRRVIIGCRNSPASPSPTVAHRNLGPSQHQRIALDPHLGLVLKANLLEQRLEDQHPPASFPFSKFSFASRLQLIAILEGGAVFAALGGSVASSNFRIAGQPSRNGSFSRSPRCSANHPFQEEKERCETKQDDQDYPDAEQPVWNIASTVDGDHCKKDDQRDTATLHQFVSGILLKNAPKE